MDIPDIGVLAPEVALLMLFAFIAALGAQLIKQPFLKGSRWNIVLAYTVCALFGVALAFLRGQLQMIDEVTFATVVADAGLVAVLGTFFYAMWMKGSNVMDKVFNLGYSGETPKLPE